MGTGPLFVKWQNFKEDKEDIRATYHTLRNLPDFADVTLACDDGVQIEAHKVILTVGSPVFTNILQGNKHPHPLIFLRGLGYDTLLSILDFIYYGEVEIEEGKVKCFMVAAEDLKLRGISAKSEENIPFTDHSQRSENKQKVTLGKEDLTISQNKIMDPTVENTMQGNTFIDNITPIKLANKPKDTRSYFVIKGIETDSIPPFVGSTEPYLDTSSLEESGSEMPKSLNEDIQYECTVCGKVLKSKSLLGAHAQRHLPGFSKTTDDNICPKCEKVFETKRYMHKHISIHHNNVKFKTRNRFKDLDAEIKPFITKVGQGIWMCKVCGTKGSKTKISIHVESRHMDISIPCTKCGHISKNRDGLRAHSTRSCKFQNIE